MAVQAYVLINVKAGKAYEVWEKLEKFKEVQQADAVSGPYDIIALVRCLDFDTLGYFVLEKVQKLDGVERTITCPIFRLTEH